jgi:hypothetical protein
MGIFANGDARTRINIATNFGVGYLVDSCFGKILASLPTRPSVDTTNREKCQAPRGISSSSSRVHELPKDNKVLIQHSVACSLFAPSVPDSKTEI